MGMTDALSSEKLPLSQREPLTHHYVTNTLGANTYIAELVNRFNVEPELTTAFPKLSDYAIEDLNVKITEADFQKMIVGFEKAGVVLQTVEGKFSAFTGRMAGPVRSLIALFKRWGISDLQAAELLGQQSSSFISDLRAGTAGLNTRDIQDRAKLILSIYEGVHTLLRQADAERSWINAKLEALEDSSILDIMLRGSIADLMYAKSYVDYVNGR
jgi:hypothetical protein